MTTHKKEQKGVSGIRFLIISCLVLLVMMGVGLTTIPSSMALTKLQGAAKVLGEVAIALGFVIVLGSLYNFIVFTQILDAPLWHLGPRLRRERNDSHAILFVAGYALAAVSVVLTLLTKTDFWLFEMLTSTALGHLVGLFMATLFAGSVGARSLDKLKEYIEKEDNDSHAILVSGLYLVFFTTAFATSMLVLGTILGGGA